MDISGLDWQNLKIITKEKGYKPSSSDLYTKVFWKEGRIIFFAHKENYIAHARMINFDK